MSTNSVITAQKLDNGYWQITIFDPITQGSKTITDVQFYRVKNKDINLKNYIYTDANNEYIYFNRSYSPKFIAQLVYLYSTFAYNNGILDKDILKIERELNNQGITLSKYGLSQINDKTIYSCLDIDPYPESLRFKCLSDRGILVEKNIPDTSNYLFLRDIINLGETEVKVNVWNFSYIVFGGVAFFMIVFLYVMRVDKN
jgi:hypothetical protein